MTQFFIGTTQELITELNNYENIRGKKVLEVNCIGYDGDKHIYKILISNYTQDEGN